MHTWIWRGSREPSGKVLYCMKTMFPTSRPETKYSIEGPRLPPPAHTSSMNVISSGGICSSSVSQRKLNSTHSSAQNFLSLGLLKTWIPSMTKPE